MVSDIDGRELNLSWDSKYELKRVKLEGKNKEVNYQYNVLGQRVARSEVVAGFTNTEYYVHDGVNVVADLDEDKELLRSYAYAPGYDNIISMTSYGNETNTYFYIRNYNNSVVALIDENGDVAESYDYDAYGKVTVFDSNGNELDESALGNRYTFQGREIDWSTGLYNFRARWYDAETGRWLSKDPIGIRGGLNQYVFCGNNPVMFVDPEGLWTFQFGGFATAGAFIGGQRAGGFAVSHSKEKGWMFGFYGTHGGGEHRGVGGGTGMEISFSLNDGIDDLAGFGREDGVSWGFFGLSGNIPDDCELEPTYTFSGGFGLSTPESHTHITNTEILEYGFEDLIRDVKPLISNPVIAGPTL